MGLAAADCIWEYGKDELSPDAIRGKIIWCKWPTGAELLGQSGAKQLRQPGLKYR